MAAPVAQSGAAVPCPACTVEVLQKEMIPVSAGETIVAYLCVPCARKQIRTDSPSG